MLHRTGSFHPAPTDTRTPAASAASAATLNINDADAPTALGGEEHGYEDTVSSSSADDPPDRWRDSGAPLALPRSAAPCPWPPNFKKKGQFELGRWATECNRWLGPADAAAALAGRPLVLIGDSLARQARSPCSCERKRCASSIPLFPVFCGRTAPPSFPLMEIIPATRNPAQPECTQIFNRLVAHLRGKVQLVDNYYHRDAIYFANATSDHLHVCASCMGDIRCVHEDIRRRNKGTALEAEGGGDGVERRLTLVERPIIEIRYFWAKNLSRVDVGAMTRGAAVALLVAGLHDSGDKIAEIKGALKEARSTHFAVLCLLLCEVFLCAFC